MSFQPCKAFYVTDIQTVKGADMDKNVCTQRHQKLNINSVEKSTHKVLLI